METSTYFVNSRPEMLPFVPDSASVLLEIGCGSGTFATGLKERRAAAGSPVEIWGVEMDEQAARQASQVLDRVLHGDVATVGDQLPPEHFDCVILNDVIEHVPEPAALLQSLRPLLKSDGHLVASIPNVRYFFNVVDLAVHGRWEYADEGILDRTHLRFFTRSSMMTLLTENGFQVETMVGINPTGSAKFHLVNLLTLGRLSDMKYLQFACRARVLQAVE